MEMQPGQVPENPAAASDAETQIAELGKWIETRVPTRDRLITLPLTGERYAIRGPDRAAHARIFAAARDAGEAHRPYWADVWPSGLALADAALLRADQLAGVPTLELGCGLGVTATAALAAGADLAVGDYAPLSLAFCRLNALRNTGAAPRPLTFDWRDPLSEIVVKVGEPSQFPIILAADVLYERHDIAPLAALIDRLLAPGGQVWLAEPGRDIARRFLETLKAAGWHDEVERLDGPWPGGEAARVRLHTLRRPGEA